MPENEYNKNMQELYIENYETLIEKKLRPKEIKDRPCSCIGRLILVMIFNSTINPFRSNTIPSLVKLTS